MLRDLAKVYYGEKNYNCAEAVLLAANDEYGLGIGAEATKLVGGFGGGMGCGRACGALCGGIAAIGQACIEEKAHSSPAARGFCAAYATRFAEDLGGDQCIKLKELYMKDDVRCLETVLRAADVLEGIFADIPV